MLHYKNNQQLLFTEEEYNNCKSRDTLPIKCFGCETIFYITKNSLQCKLKRGHNIYCTTQCASKHKTEMNTVLVKCENCGKEFTIHKSQYEYSTTKHFFCSHNCSASYNNKLRIVSEEQKIKTSKTMRKNFNTLNENISNENYLNENKERKRNLRKSKKVCKVCGQTICKHPEICKSYFFRNTTTLSKFNFDTTKIGTEKVIEEYNKLQKYISSLYYTKLLSYPEICKIHNIKHLHTLELLFKFLNIKARTLSESVINAVSKGTLVLPQKDNMLSFKTGYHTSWENKQFFYRSSYELDYMLELDSNKIPYNVESFKIKYFNTQKQRYAIAIPDFYLPDTKTIVEVKSEYTYDKQEMIDKSNEYKRLGFNFILLYEHQQYDYCI